VNTTSQHIMDNIINKVNSLNLLGESDSNKKKNQQLITYYYPKSIAEHFKMINSK